MIIYGYVIVILLGLVVGSFLNVIIHRLPIMMKRQWHLQSCEILGQTPTHSQRSINLIKPNSHCPHCHSHIKPWHNIPLLSYIMLKGRCKQCQHAIPLRYPLIELITGLVSGLIFWRFGYTPEMGLFLILSWGLIAASGIDIAEQFIPDTITLPLLWLGLLANTFLYPVEFASNQPSFFVGPSAAILGAVIGYLFFWIIAKLFYLVRKKEGLGHGDFKLLALFGAWIGVWPLLNIIIVSSILAIILSIAFLCFKKIRFSSQIPFGPFLAIGGWCTIVFGDFITNAIIKF